jgi:drug/metabolite transporter (DMT)-like permease
MHETLTRPLPWAPATSLRVPPELTGIAAGLGAATIWGGALAMTRHGVADAGALGPHDIVLLRFAAPALLLLPLAWRALRRVGRAEWPRLVALVAGGGAPFVLLAGAGLREAAAADAGALLPGTVPLWVALLSLGAGRGVGAGQRVGLGLMLAAVAVVAGPALVAGEGWRGPVLLIAASWLAALYTLALRGMRLSALEATAIVSVASVAGFAPLYLLALQPGIGGAGWGQLAMQLAWQGGLSGLLAPIAFALAVARLGAARAASFGALSPAAATGFGAVLMGELPDAPACFGVVAAACGVALAARMPR